MRGMKKTPLMITPEKREINRFRGEFLSWRSIFRRLSRSRTNLSYTLLMNLGYRSAYLANRKPSSSRHHCSMR